MFKRNIFLRRPMTLVAKLREILPMLLSKHTTNAETKCNDDSALVNDLKTIGNQGYVAWLRWWVCTISTNQLFSIELVTSWYKPSWLLRVNAAPLIMIIIKAKTECSWRHNEISIVLLGSLWTYRPRHEARDIILHQANTNASLCLL